MSKSASILPEEIGFDRILSFTIPGLNARGRVVRLGPVLETILGAHHYPIGIRKVLAEALVLTALIGALLKDEGSQLTIQAQTEGGVVELLVCDYRGRELRGYVRHDPSRLDSLGPNPSLAALFGRGFLAVTFDLAATGQRYQGIVPLEGASLAEACQTYFERSEQVPTLIRVAVDVETGQMVAGGLLVQHLAAGEAGHVRLHARVDHPEWEHVSVLASSTRASELVDPKLSLEALTWRLFHEESQVRVEQGPPLVRGCRCSIAHYESVLARFPDEDREQMRNEEGFIPVECEFCSKSFSVHL